MGLTPAGVEYVKTSADALFKLDLYLRRLATAEADSNSILAGKYRTQVTMWASVAQTLMMQEERQK